MNVTFLPKEKKNSVGVEGVKPAAASERYIALNDILNKNDLLKVPNL